MSETFNVRLIACLSATEYCSGEHVAAELGCSRTAVWKHVEELRALGVGVEARPGRGYRLREPLELLDGERILARLSPGARSSLVALKIPLDTDSTNSELQRLPAESRHAVAVLAERQAQGRGRRGRSWHSPFARNVYLSLGWRFDTGVGELGSLPLVVALAASDAIRAMGVGGHLIKWPNDLLLGGRKLAGCLVEVQGDASGPCTAVMGVGVNVRMPCTADAEAAIDQPWTDIASQVPGISRNELAAVLLDRLLQSARSFGLFGFDPFRERWAAVDGLAGQAVSLLLAAGRVAGTACGISDRGGLLVKTAKGVRECLTGEVSVRRAVE